MTDDTTDQSTEDLSTVESPTEPQEDLEKPFVPFNARSRRRDGNVMWGKFSGWLKAKAADLLLSFGPIEFVWTLLTGPVAYTPQDVWTSGGEVEAAITSPDVERVRQLYEHSRELIEREEATRMSVEARANALLATGGLTATLIVGISGLLIRGDLEHALPSGSAARMIFTVLYLLGLYSLVMSLLRAVQTVGVTYNQPFGAKRPFLVQNYAELPRLRALIREAFLTFVDLREINRLKVGLLASAQWWFGTALIALLLLAAVPVLATPMGRFWLWLVNLLGDCGILIALAIAILVGLLCRRKYTS